MNFSRSYTTIDAHTAGEPLRIVTAGVPRLPGATILEKRRWVKENMDDVRKTLMWEPRGHADMYGAYLTEPVTPQADMGVIFMHNEGYSDMCGHGIIALATVAVAQGLVKTTTPETRVGIDAPAGFIEAFAEWDGERVGAVRFRNVPSFLYLRDLKVATPSFGSVTVDVAFGGAFYAYLDGAQAGLEVTPTNYRALISLGDEVKRGVSAEVEIQHPLIPELNQLYGTIIDGAPQHKSSTQANVCVFADREGRPLADRHRHRGARVAQLYARGKLGLNKTLVNESVIGTVFTGKVLEETKVGDYDAVVPEVGGQAYITGFNHFVLEPDDPVGTGFFLR